MCTFRSLAVFVWILRSVTLAEEKAVVAYSEDEKILELPTPYPLFKIPFLPPHKGISLKDMVSIRGSRIFKDTNMDMFLHDENGNVIDQPALTPLTIVQEPCISSRELTAVDYLIYFIISIVSFLGGQIISFKKSKKASTTINSTESYNQYLEIVLLDVERLNASGKLDESRAIIRAAMEVAYTSKFKMPNDPGTLYHVLASTEILAGDKETALKYMSYSYEIYENSLGLCEETAYLLEDMACVLESMGRFEEAAAMIKKSEKYLQNCAAPTEKSSLAAFDDELIEYKNALLRRANELVASIHEGEDDEDPELASFLRVEEGSPASVKRDTTRLLNDFYQTSVSPKNHVKALGMYIESKRIAVDEERLVNSSIVDQHSEEEVNTNVDLIALLSPEKMRSSPDCIDDIEIAN